MLYRKSAKPAQTCNWVTGQVETCALTSSVLDGLVQTELMTEVNMINVIHPTSLYISLTCAPWHVKSTVIIPPPPLTA